jgi:hypothetical protein
MGLAPSRLAVRREGRLPVSRPAIEGTLLNLSRRGKRSKDSPTKMTGWQTEMSENPGGHRGIFNSGDDLQCDTTLGGNNQ